MQRTRKILVIILSSLFLLFGIAIALTFVYEEKINQYLLGSINEQIEAEVRSKDVNFSLLRKFPFASVELMDVSITPKNKKLPALFSSSRLFLEFNIIDIVRGKYSIRNIDVRKGKLCIYDSLSVNNYEIFRKTKDGKGTSFNLKRVRVDDLKVNFIDANSGFDMQSMIKKAVLKGNFAADEYDLAGEIEGRLKSVRSGEVTWVRERPFMLKSDLVVKGERFLVDFCSITSGNLKFLVDGSFDTSEELVSDLHITGDDLGILELYEFLPQGMRAKELESYNSEGKLDVVSDIKGKGEKTAINVNFKVRKGSITHKKDGTSLRNIRLSGNFTNGKNFNTKSSVVKVSDFYAETDGGRVSGNFTLKDPSSPHLAANVKLTSRLEKIFPFLSLKEVESISGSAEAQVHYDGPLKKETKARDLVKSGGYIKLKGLNLKLKDLDKPFTDLNGVLQVDRNDLLIEQLGFTLNEGKYTVKGSIDNLIPAVLMEKEKTTASLNVRGDLLDFSTFINDADDAGSDTSESTVSIPVSTGDITLAFSGVRYGKFNATNVNGTLRIDEGHVSTDDLAFNTMGGSLRFSGTLSEDKGILVRGKTEMDNINITDLFIAFNNFGQTVLVDKQIKGVADAKVAFTCKWDRRLNFLPESIHAVCDLVVDKGELINFEPMYHLSKYVSLAELKHIRFSQLKNSFIIKDNSVIVPEMEIHSNALNLVCSGTHFFSNKIDYRFKLALNDLLWQKAKSSKSENEEFGVIEDDGLGKINLYLSMTGDVDDPHLAYDKVGLKKGINKEIKDERQAVKGLLKQEFGVFKSDSTAKVPAPKKEKNLQVEWEENTTPVNDKNPPVQKKEERGKVGKLLQKTGKPEKEESSGENSDDFN